MSECDRQLPRSLQPPRLVEIRTAGAKGWGVFAVADIDAGELIEESPVLVFPTMDLYHPHGTSCLASYVFVWDNGRMALPLGFGAIYNHSYHPNAVYEDGEGTKRYLAIRGIAAGEEVTINYNGHPQDKSPVGFPVLD